MANPVIESSVEQTGGNVFTKPSGLADNDVLYLLYWSWHGDTGAPSAPAAFASPAGGGVQYDGSNTFEYRIYRKVITNAAGEGASYTVTRGSGTNWADGGEIFRVSGVDNTTPEDHGSDNTGTSTSAVTDTFSTTVADCLLLMVEVNDGLNAGTPAGMSQLFSHDGGDSEGFGESLTGTVTNTTRAATLSSSRLWGVAIVAVAPPSAGGFTGTMAATLQTAGFAGAGGPAQIGAMAAQLQDLVFAAAGAQQPSGVLAAQLRAALASMNGAQILTVAIAASIQPATFSGAGGQTQEGAMAATLQLLTSTMQGVMQPEGQLASILQAATMAAAGGQQQSGGLAAALQGPTFAGAGGAGFLGVLAAILQAATMSASGVMQPEGALAAALVGPTFAGQGAQTLEGTLAGSLRPATFAGTGTAAGGAVTGAIAATVQVLAFAAAGVMSPEGVFAATMQALRMAAQGSLAQEGVLEAELQEPTFAGSGGQSQESVLAASLQAAGFAGAGGPAQIGVMAAQLQDLVFAAAGAEQPSGVMAVQLQTLVAALVALVPVDEWRMLIASGVWRDAFVAAGVYGNTSRNYDDGMYDEGLYDSYDAARIIKGGVWEEVET